MRRSSSRAAIDPSVNPAMAARTSTSHAGAPFDDPGACAGCDSSSVGSRDRARTPARRCASSPRAVGLDPDRLHDGVDLAPDLLIANGEGALRVCIGEPGRSVRRGRGGRDAEDVALAQWLDVDVALDRLLVHAASEATSRLLGCERRGHERGRGLDGASGVARIAHQRRAEEGAVVLRERRHQQLCAAREGWCAGRQERHGDR